MINPAELRLGNYVLDRGKKVIRIDFFEHLDNDYDCKFGQYVFLPKPFPNELSKEAHPLTEYTDYAEPIPITESWLKNLGLTEDTNSYLREAEGWWTEDGLLNIRIEYAISGYSYSVYLSGHDMDLAYEGFKYVHQLQNMYFGLTGKELTLCD